MKGASIIERDRAPWFAEEDRRPDGAVLRDASLEGRNSSSSNLVCSTLRLLTRDLLEHCIGRLKRIESDTISGDPHVRTWKARSRCCWAGNRTCSTSLPKQSPLRH